MDSLLLPFLSSVDSEEEEILTHLMSEHVAPVARQILRYKLQFHFGHADGKVRDPDVEEVFNEIQLHLLKRLRQLKQDSAHSAVGNLHSYVAASARHACDEYLRRKYPRRRNLKDKIRYYLTTRDEFTLRESAEEGWLAGLARWNKQGLEFQSARDPGRPLELQALLHTKLQATDARRLKLDALIRAVLDAWGEPLELDCLTALIAKLWGVEDHPDETIDGDDGVGRSVEVAAATPATPDAIVEYHQLLEQLWREIRQLPRRQRVALLLNLRNPQRINVVTLLPAIHIATFEQIAEALEIPLEQFEDLWADLPMEDTGIAELLGATRQQVINLRKNARNRLTRRMKALERKHL